MAEALDRRRVLQFAALCALALAVAATAAQFWLRRQANDAEARLQALAEQLRATAAAPAASAPPDPREAWLHTRDRTPPGAEALIADVQRMGTGLGVTLAGLSATSTAATPQALGRLDIALTLRGSHANLRTLLAELLDRHRGVVVQRLSFRRFGSPTEVEAQFALQWPLPPAPLPTQASAVAP